MAITEETVKAWLETKGLAAKYKKLEGDSRRIIADEVLDGKVKGVKRETFGGLIVAATGKVNLNVDKDELKVIWKELTTEDRAAVKFKPEVVAGKYNKLPKDSMLRRVVTIKPGMPTVEVKPVVA